MFLRRPSVFDDFERFTLDHPSTDDLDVVSAPEIGIDIMRAHPAAIAGAEIIDIVAIALADPEATPLIDAGGVGAQAAFAQDALGLARHFYWKLETRKTAGRWPTTTS